MKAAGLEKSSTSGVESSVRVLLLEESLADSQDILEELRATGMTIEPTVVSTRQEFLEAIGSQDFSIVLSAYRLPDWSGLEAFEELQKAGKAIPFILVTGVFGE